MPDLTTIYVQECDTDCITEQMLSSKGTGEYTVTACHDETMSSCTCPGYGYRGKCRHITELREKLCSWNEQVGPEAQTPQQEMEAVCPKCGGPTRTIRMGV